MFGPKYYQSKGCHKPSQGTRNLGWNCAVQIIDEHAYVYHGTKSLLLTGEELPVLECKYIITAYLC